MFILHNTKKYVITTHTYKIEAFQMGSSDCLCVERKKENEVIA